MSLLIEWHFTEKITMRIVENICLLIVPILLLITLSLVNGHRQAFAENPELSSAVFYVQ